MWSHKETTIVQATQHNLGRAIRYVESLVAGGETNINGALLEAMEIVSEVKTRPIMKVCRRQQNERQITAKYLR